MTTKSKIRITIGLIIIISGIVLLITSGCATPEMTKTTETRTLTDGTKVVTETTKTKEGLLTSKTYAVGGAVSAVKVETTGGTSSGTFLPNFMVGGGVTSVASSPNKAKKRALTFSWSAGVLASITNTSASSGTLSYVSDDGETAEETVKILNAAVKVKESITGSSTTETEKEEDAKATTEEAEEPEDNSAVDTGQVDSAITSQDIEQ